MRYTLFSKKFIQRMATMMAAVLFYEAVSLPLAQAAVVAPPTPKNSSLSLLSSQRQIATQHLKESFTVPSSVGTLADSYAPSTAGRLVYHFQDVHDHVAAQTNLAEMVSLLENYAGKQGKNLVIAVEGATGSIDSDRLAKLPNQKNKEDVGAALLRAGYFMGEEYAAITSAPGRIKLVGIETSSLYHHNVAARSESRQARNRVLTAIKEVHSQLEKLKRHNFSTLLATLEEKRNGVDEGTISLTDYATFLANTNAAVVAAYPQLARLVHVNSLEKTVNFNSVEKEGQSLVTELTLSASNDRVEKMMRDAESLKNGQLSALTYYSGLLQQTHKSYPTLEAYVAYLRAADGIDTDRLFDEVMLAEEQIAHKLIRHPLAQQLYDHLRWAENAEKFFSLNLIPQEWARQQTTDTDGVRAQLASIRSFINEQQMDLGYHFVEPVITTADLYQAVNGARSFYEAASNRNRAMFDNLEAVLRDNPADKSIVAFIAGGFHTPDMTKFLRSKGIAYEVFRPQLDTEVQLSTEFNMTPRKVDYLRRAPGLTDASVVKGAEEAIEKGNVPTIEPTVEPTQSSYGRGYVTPAVALAPMLERAAQLAGVSVSDLRDPKVLAEAVDLFNAEVGGLAHVIRGRSFEQTTYKPIEIVDAVTDEMNKEFADSVSKGERVWMIAAAGRATRMKLPAEFDRLGIAGLTPKILKALKAAGYEDASKTPRNGEFTALIDRAVSGVLNDADDESFLQRDARRLVEQTKEIAQKIGANQDAMLKGLRLIVVVNSANREALRNQIKAINFPGQVIFKEQQERGGVTIDEQGVIHQDNTSVFPEGHGEPFIAIAQERGHTYELNADGSEREITEPLQVALANSGAKYLFFGQVNDLHLLGDMASVQRWDAALQTIKNDGTQLVLEMVENGLKQKGGGAFKFPDSENVVLRDTLAMKTPEYAHYTIPTNISRMTYVMTVEALGTLDWTSIPAYLNVRAGAGTDGATLITREFYSGDASSALKTRTMVQPALAINTFKERPKLENALSVIAAEDAAHPFVRPNGQNGSVVGAFWAFFISLAMLLAVVGGGDHSFIQNAVAVVAFLPTFGFLALSSYWGHFANSIPNFASTFAAEENNMPQNAANDLTKFATKFGLKKENIEIVGQVVEGKPGILARVTKNKSGEKVLQIRSALLYNTSLRRSVLKHEMWHFSAWQLNLSKNDVLNHVLEFLNEIPAFVLGLISLPFSLDTLWGSKPSDKDEIDHATTVLQSLTAEQGEAQKKFINDRETILNNQRRQQPAGPRTVILDLATLNADKSDDLLNQAIDVLNAQLKNSSIAEIPELQVVIVNSDPNNSSEAGVFEAAKRLGSFQGVRVHTVSSVRYAEITDGASSDDALKKILEQEKLMNGVVFADSAKNAAGNVYLLTADPSLTPSGINPVQIFGNFIQLGLAFYSTWLLNNPTQALGSFADVIENITKIDIRTNLLKKFQIDQLAEMMA